MGSNPTADTNFFIGRLERNNVLLLLLNSRFVGLAVMTFALHAKGPRFDPGTKYLLDLRPCASKKNMPPVRIELTTLGL